MTLPSLHLQASRAESSLRRCPDIAPDVTQDRRAAFRGREWQMMDGPGERRYARRTAEGATGTRLRRILAVSIDPKLIARLPRHVLEPSAYVARVAFEDLDEIALAGPDAPGLILSPLVTPVFDAVDLARHLRQRGFQGRYLALVDKLPSANLIRREVEAQAPGLNFDVVVLDGSSPLHSL